MKVKTLKPEIGGRYRLRNGDIVKVTGGRHALMLDGKNKEFIFYGKFEDGSLCAWNANGTYRASGGLKPYPLDIMVEES